jgi:hypothetical protein
LQTVGSAIPPGEKLKAEQDIPPSTSTAQVGFMRQNSPLFFLHSIKTTSTLHKDYFA